MRFLRKASHATALILVVARVGGAQAGAAPPTTHQAMQIDSAFKKLGVFAYPAKGQSAEQQKHDEQECYAWAKGQTNFDPMTAAAPNPEAAAKAAEQGVADATQGAAVGGAVKGTAAGALIGGAAGDAGKGAAIGAATGAVVGRSRKKKAEKQAGAQAAAAATAPNPQVDAFKKAVGTCLQGRGYTFGK